MKALRIIYLGGMYWAEYSMLFSFINNGGEIVFPIDDNDFKETYYSRYNPKSLNIIQVPGSKLAEYVARFRPDAVIHRHYMGSKLMHCNAAEISSSLNIPYVIYEQETNINDNSSCTDRNCDAIFYTHDTPVVCDRIASLGIPSSFVPYGVSPYERMLPVTKIFNVGNIGRYYPNNIRRGKSMRMWISAARGAKETIHFHGNDWRRWREDVLTIHPGFSMDESTGVINQHKVMVNIGGLDGIEGGYSYKLWQSAGCGIPTITQYKKSLWNMMGDNITMVNSIEEASEKIRQFIADDNLRATKGDELFRFVHAKFQWYDLFKSALKKTGII